MNRSAKIAKSGTRYSGIAKSTLLLLAVLAGLGSCSTTKQSIGPRQTDDLVGWVERVHVECELSRQRADRVLDRLHAIVKQDFAGNAVTAFTEFELAIEQSEDRASELRMSYEPMLEAGVTFFEEWMAGLDAFTNQEMREHSEKRMHHNRERYAAIVRAVQPTLVSYNRFNLALRDHALFLSHDFNTGAASEIETQVRALTQQARELDAQFEECMTVARAYVQEAALPVRVQVDVIEITETPVTESEQDPR